MASGQQAAKRVRVGGRNRYFLWSSIAVLIFTVAGFGGLAETNKAGFIKILQIPVTGTMKVFQKPGMFAQVFGNWWEYKQAGTYRFNLTKTLDSEGIQRFSKESNPVEVRFSDAGVAYISGNVRFDMPGDDADILKIHRKFRSYENLTRSLIQPAVAEALILTASLMTAEESYSGRRAEYAQLAWDQVLNGVYLTEWKKTETIDPVTNERTTRRVVRIKRNKDGSPERKPNPLQTYNITVSQFFLDKDIAYEKGVLDQIKTQRDAMMKTVTARADALKAQQDRITAEAKGKAEVMTAKYAAEVIKETAVVDATRKLEVAKLNKLQAEQIKQEQILLGQGEAERKRLNIQADGALAPKLAAIVEIQAGWANAFATRKVPNTVFAGTGAPSNGTDADVGAIMKLIQVNMARELSVDMTTQ